MSTTNDLRDDVPALFVPDGRDLVPTVFAVGPWRPDAVHGAALAALFAGALDRPDMTVARLTIDLAAAVRLDRMRLEVEDLNGGRRVQRCSAVLRQGERAVAAASALYVAQAGEDGPGAPTGLGRSQPVLAPPAPLEVLPESRAGWPGFENRAMALHTQRGEHAAFEGWFELLMPAVAGDSVTGLQGALAAADYSSAGTAVMLSLEEWSFMSIDLTVNLARPPAGSWVGVRGDKSTLSARGVAVAGSVLHDQDGVFGRCTQTQLLRRVG